MHISVVIPTLNEADHIPYLLQDIEQQTQKPFEVFVVDGGSVDKTQLLVKKHRGVKLCTSRPSVSLQRNIGGQKAQGDYIIFLDADVRLPQNFLEVVSRQIKDKKATIACPWYFPYNSTIPICTIYFLFSTLFFLFQKISPSGAGSCIVVKKNLFSDTQFDQSLIFDDIDFIRRGAKKGNFRILNQKIYVSDRRFKRNGVLTTFFLYLVLSFFFLMNQFKLANKITYPFAHYTKR